MPRGSVDTSARPKGRSKRRAVFAAALLLIVGAVIFIAADHGRRAARIVGEMMLELKSKPETPTADRDILILLGDARFKLDKRYLYWDQLRKGGRRIKDTAKVDVFDFDFWYPDMSWVDISEEPDPRRRVKLFNRRGNKVSVSIRKDPRLDYKYALSHDWITGPHEPESEFDSDRVKKFLGSGMRKDIYIYGNDEAFMRCYPSDATDLPPSPSCRLTFAYRGMEVSARFSQDHKFDFLEIKKTIEHMLSSFEAAGAEN